MKIFKEKVTNIHGVKWVRTHAVGVEGEALCFGNYEDPPEVEEGIGQITCVDCIEIIKLCKSIKQSDLAPEYENELFNKRTKQ